jgi:hypothetical protein
VNQQWSFQNIEVRGYGGLCLTRPAGGVGALSMQACTNGASQLWRVKPSEVISSFVRVYSEDMTLCLTLRGSGGSDARAEDCRLKLYLPLVMRSAGTQSNLLESSDGTGLAPAAPAAGEVREFYLAPGGQISVPSLFSDSLCLDVQDVWDSDFTAGMGGPQIGQRVQFFKCYSTQLNQKWNWTGHVVSGYVAAGPKCLMLTGAFTQNGAGAVAGPCSPDAPQKNWDYDW